MGSGGGKKTKGRAKASTKAKESNAGDDGDLAAMILSNQSSRRDPLAAIAAKYVTKPSTKGKRKGKGRSELDFDDIDDAAFEATRNRILKK